MRQMWDSKRKWREDVGLKRFLNRNEPCKKSVKVSWSKNWSLVEQFSKPEDGWNGGGSRRKEKALPLTVYTRLRKYLEK